MFTVLIVLIVLGFVAYGASFIARINRTIETVKTTSQKVKETGQAVSQAKKDITDTLDPDNQFDKDEPVGLTDDDKSPEKPATVEGFDDGSGGLLSGVVPPVGSPARSFVELGDMSGGYPEDIWLDNVALTIPPSNVGTTDIIFVDANRPQQCYDKCKTSPFCRFFSYWQETGSCNLHQTLQNGETTPENMLRYAYTVPFSQKWVSGYVRKSGGPVPEESRL